MEGSHQQLLKSEERYRRLYTARPAVFSNSSKQLTNC